MKFRSRQTFECEAAFFDGELVGTPDLAVEKVRPRSCPDWFPALTPEKDPIFAKPGEIVSYADKLYIVTEHGMLTVSPGDWIVRRKDGWLDRYPREVFAQLFERVL